MKQGNNFLPKLRFSDFQDKWKIKELDNYIELLSGYAFKGDDISDINNGIPLLRGINITEGRIRHSKDIDRYYNETVVGLEKYLLQEDDLVLGMDGSKVGKNVSLISKEDVGSLLIQRVARIRAKDSTDIRFIYLYIFSERFHKYVDKVNTSSGIPHISSKQIKEFSIGFPSLPEQQKIASFLTDVDDKITKLTKKKTLLEQYKKGVMQKIFNQELRFKDDNGNAFPDWEVKKLGGLVKRAQSGGTPKSTNKSYYNGDIPFLSISDMTEQGKYLNYTTKSISKLGVDNSSTWIVPSNSLIYSMYASVGFVSINKIDLATSQAVMNIILKDNINIEYIYYYLVDFKQHIHRMIETGTQGNINASIVKGIKIDVPVVEEQTKIANFLSDIDVKIEALNTKIEHTKAFKKGLLQQMFV